MIVAPLMTPILGIVFSVTIGDGRNLAVSAALVLAGALAVVAVGFLFGLLAEVPVDAATSSQVSGRVNPSLIDLAAAVATGPSARSRWCAPTSPTRSRASPSPSPSCLRSRSWA
jgi:uncharacterized membrane protein